jgi:hypothetical protein
MRTIPTLLAAAAIAVAPAVLAAPVCQRRLNLHPFSTVES